MEIKNVGENLKILRRDQRLNQKDLAKKIGCTQNAISNWENGTRIPDLHYIKKISEALDVPPNLLLRESDDLKQSLKESALESRYGQKLKIVTEEQLRNYELRKELARLFPITHPGSKEPTWHQIVLYTPNPKIKLYLLIEIEAPYGDGDSVIFDDTKSKTAIIREFKILKGKHFLCPLNDTQTVVPLWSEGQRYHYIGKILPTVRGGG